MHEILKLLCKQGGNGNTDNIPYQCNSIIQIVGYVGLGVGDIEEFGVRQRGEIGLAVGFAGEDHGEALGEVHGQLQYWSHMTVNVHEENIKVPFMLRPARGISPSLAEPLSLVDLPNLVAACFGLPEVFPQKPAGTVFATGATDQFGKEWERTISAGQRAYRSALITGERKYHLVGDAFEVEKICDLKSDPGETAPIGDAVSRPELQDLLKPFVRPISFGRNRSAEVDADVLERLRDLGYVE